MKGMSYNLVFKALSNKTRMDILQALREKPMNVGELCARTGYEQSRVSHNLRILLEWDFVGRETEGKQRTYKIKPRHIEPILKHAEKYLLENQDKLKNCDILQGKKTCRHLKRK